MRGREFEIPVLDVGALFGPATAARAALDREILQTAQISGFMTIVGLPAEYSVSGAERAGLLRIFQLAESEVRTLWRQKFDPSRPNVYRGWFPLQDGDPTYKEGIDLGPDVAYGTEVVEAGDVLREATPLPAEVNLPGWHEAVARYYRAMECIGSLLMRAVARGLGLTETHFDAVFARGCSTLRLIHYPPRPDAPGTTLESDGRWIEHDGELRAVVGRPHVDSGFVTLLAQDDKAGLQARAANGAWIDVAPTEGALVVNFGRLLERWTGARIRATEHRVLSVGADRYSIPFFYEPRADAMIAPLPLKDVAPFTPFLYGDHLWSLVTQFVEFRGMEGLRPPRAATPAAKRDPTAYEVNSTKTT